MRPAAEKRRVYPPINMGISLLLVTFILLCMVLFATLSLSGAAKDYGYSQKNAQRTTAYYQANNLAEEILDGLYNNPPIITDGEHAMINSAGMIISVTVTPETMEYSVPINEDEVLYVILDVISREPVEYKISTWKQISVKEWTGQQNLPVLGSD